MSASTPPLLPPLPVTWYDRGMSRFRSSALATRRLDLWAPIAVTVLAALLRFLDLGHPRAIVFDETYYVKDAWSQWVLGYPSAWPADADKAFASGAVDVSETGASFVVHPPLGKWLIGAGMWLFGPGDSFGWRFSTALFGTALVLLVYLVTRTLTRSTPVATLAGGLMAIDGLAIVMSRVALLDVFLAFFVLLAFWFVLWDQRQHTARLDRALAGTQDPPWWGPLSWNRPWLIAAGVALGAATGVKWSGVYVIAALGVYVVVTDALARRRLQVGMWPMDAVRQGIVAFLYLVPTAFVVYLSSWTGWLLSSDGYMRQSAVSDPATGFWSWVPLPLQSLWNYHEAMYRFHVGLSTPHSYESPAWQWPLLVRPTSMYWQQDGDTVQAISSIPNPLIWWGGVAAAVFLIYLFVRTRRVAYAFVLTGIAATYVPWLLYPSRTIFQFYTIAILPFLVIAIALAAREIVGGGSPERRVAGIRVVTVFVVVAVVLAAFWYPVQTALPVPYEFWRLHNWLPTWI
ncbi:dolichyl-phosphate-mannose--protein mannosyltransferase [Microbacterium sp. SORGH_AS_0888]|uniref:dolichyl-phosphate-mannose--protein mannosyltransferase n=1 Tax=Microbacterium sp. SORGH_AS_0888 TaxID=3041791 RepID=UPI002782A77F|nr:phospholipid carrier-dependent glycosyltransferase [Microbacterium sp. SORGH_AS_0888]MDQ1129153.1 dolichyl-phosphate-mannose-protein mannosyltransferase [Microbacterium sp. SORGH_AS_0888]